MGVHPDSEYRGGRVEDLTASPRRVAHLTLCVLVQPVPLDDSLSSVAGAARRPALFPQLFPIPDPVRDLFRQRESELMREHTPLSAVVGAS